MPGKTLQPTKQAVPHVNKLHTHKINYWHMSPCARRLSTTKRQMDFLAREKQVLPICVGGLQGC